MENRIYSPTSLGQILKGERTARGLNQSEAGEKFGLNQATVSAIERGKPGTRLDTVLRHLAALGLEMVIRPSESKPLSKDGELW